MEEAKLIRPREMNFSYNLSRHDCYRRYAGHCSLDENFDDNIIWNSSIKDLHKEYCQSLYVNIKNNGVKSPVIIHKNKCGHYSFTSGQRRICISKKMNLIIPGYVTDNGDHECYDCRLKKASFTYWLKSLLGLNNTFAEK